MGITIIIESSDDDTIMNRLLNGNRHLGTLQFLFGISYFIGINVNNFYTNVLSVCIFAVSLNRSL